MSLGAIDFGLLVDGAIVMLEVALIEIAVRRAQSREDVSYLVAQSMGKAARPVVFSLLIILLVYLPLMALEGVEGRMFKPMAITVALALGGALLFSLTAFPALAATVLGPVEAARQVRRPVRPGAARATSGCSTGCLPRPKLVLAVAALARSSGPRVVATSLGAEFVPRLDEGELSLDVKRLPSISITEAQRLGVQVEDVLARIPEVQVGRHPDRARSEVATDPVGPDETEVMVKLRPKDEWTTAHDLDDLGEIDQAAGRVPGPGDVRVGLAADRGSREPAPGRLARRRRDQAVRTRIWSC